MAHLPHMVTAFLIWQVREGRALALEYRRRSDEMPRSRCCCRRRCCSSCSQTASSTWQAAEHDQAPPGLAPRGTPRLAAQVETRGVSSLPRVTPSHVSPLSTCHLCPRGRESKEKSLKGFLSKELACVSSSLAARLMNELRLPNDTAAAKLEHKQAGCREIAPRSRGDAARRCREIATRRREIAARSDRSAKGDHGARPPS